jgi:hypothetical protein
MQGLLRETVGKERIVDRRAATSVPEEAYFRLAVLGSWCKVRPRRRSLQCAGSNYPYDHRGVLVDEKGKSRIPVQGCAVAMIDELEKPSHTGQRFTVRN